ncbi:heme-copper oxidase subunit III family protein [Cupriavidus basilensis]|uniref:heme-copper oxidase subunit III family protein n=1 Tax=Cupriavidus TaxID=106589 RepID=UPI000447F253|nr:MULTISPECIES: heme-copper oxidase subunit III family protein [Cupriavidus]KDP88335.1 bb3-type cytochrome oxidase subunit IV [Cupriavidus sp. SK-3]MDF3885652.1 heme-copper oxidase subunit III family protein [Cupriavidus basilensis]
MSSQPTPSAPAESGSAALPGVPAPAPVVAGLRGLVADWSSDQQAFKVSWGKAMMWIFLLSDTFIFSCFLTGYMTVRIASTDTWPNPSIVFGLKVGGAEVPLLLIAIMTFVLISSSGTMAMAVNFAYRRDRVKCASLMFATALFGVAFVSMQAFEWSKLIFTEGVRPWGNPMGAPQFGSTFFMITGFHGLHVSCGVIYLLIVATKVLRGRYERTGNYQIVEIAGLYWHFVDLVWVFIFALFYLW